MKDITSNEMLFVLNVFKSPEKEYNASSMAKYLGISPMGALKIARRLEEEHILKSRQVGKARIYQIDMDNEYAKEYVKFLLRREAEQSPAYVKVWIKELRKIKNADVAVLFGSVLRKKDANDIDVLLVTGQKKFSGLRKEVENINLINISKLHPMYQAKNDVKTNIKKGDKALLSAIKGVVAFGEDELTNLIEK
ncbi:winged helix-turn-helix transcriptional regulator [Candidatus Woesearchaeota archaeon]|nr:winged helix-turn-helix transcriptional regulator [Candidatus Woesearchaeota archaeon]